MTVSPCIQPQHKFLRRGSTQPERIRAHLMPYQEGIHLNIAWDDLSQMAV
jgi:hypothetical protein